MFKYNLNQVIWYMKHGKVHSAPVLSRKYIDNYYTKDKRCTKEQEHNFAQFGCECIMYGTIHGPVPESEAYGSKQELGLAVFDLGVVEGKENA